MFKHRKHPLPSFPEGIKLKFYDLCELLDEEDLKILRLELGKHVADLLTREKVKYDKESVKSIYDRALMLLDCYKSRNSKDKKSIIGAIRYFAVAEDLVSDEIFSTGLNDDIKIMNYVLEELGFGEYAIELSS